MVGKVLYTSPYTWSDLMICFDSELFHKILCDSTIMIEKALNYTMNALNKSSELLHSFSGCKARPYWSITV